MHSVAKGDLSTVSIVKDLLSYDLRVLIPFSENTRYDLALDYDSQFIRIQCKTGRVANGSINFSCRSVYTTTDGVAILRPYTADEIDLFAVFAPALDRCFYVPINVTGVNSFKLRFEPLRKNHRVNWAEDYTLERWLSGRKRLTANEVTANK